MENTENTENTSPADRPLGYWLRGVDRLITREIDSALEADGLTRREWMVLGALAGTVDVPPQVRERIARGGKRVRALAELGWVVEADGEWTLTDEGREAAARIEQKVQTVRARVAGAVTPEQYAVTMDALEAIAREFGGIESLPMPGRFGRGPGRRFGFGPAFGRGFGRGFGPRFGPGFGGEHEHGGHGHHGHRHGHGRGDGHGRGHERHGHGDHGHGRCGHGDHSPAERSYERGFEAGFAAAQRGSAPEASDAA